jgi:ribonuclease D
LPKGARAVLDLLRVLLQQVSEEQDVAAKLIASSSDLELLASEDHPDIKPLSGWRYEIFGSTALDLKAGKLALAVKDRKVISLKTQE